MGVLPKEQKRSPKSVYFLFREDIRYIRSISKETRLLVSKRIDTSGQLAEHKYKLSAQIASLSSERKRLWNRTYRVKDEETRTAIKSGISVLSKQIAELRKEIKLCEAIEKRSVEIDSKFHTVAEINKSEGKENPKYESIRGRR